MQVRTRGADVDELTLHGTANEGELARQLPGSKWNDPENCWNVPATWACLVQIRNTFPHLEMDDYVLQYEQHLYQTRIAPAMALRLEQDLDWEGPVASRLYPLQKVGAYFTAWTGRTLLGDDMGGGKTVQGIAALLLRRHWYEEQHGTIPGPTLIVAPKKVVRSWRNHLRDWAPDLRVGLARGTAKKRREVLEQAHAGELDIVITNWDLTHRMSRLEPFGSITMTDNEKEPKELNEIDWWGVYADEAHRLIDRKAKWTRAMKAIANGTAACGTTSADTRVAMTGTPASKNAADVWSILNFLDPEQFPAYSKFIERYASTTWNRWGNLEIGGIDPARAEEFALIVDAMMIRRPKALLLPWLPAKTRIRQYVALAGKQKKAYDSMRKEMLADLDGGVLMADNALLKTLRLSQFACANGEMLDRGRTDDDGNQVLDLQLKMNSCKVDAMLEIIEEAGNQQLVFGAASRQLIALCEDALTKKKIPFSLLVGGQTDKESEHQETMFESGQTRVALCVISAVKEGINSLVVAPTLVFLQKSDSMIDNDQFEDRIHRDGQKADKVTIIEVLAEDTVEEYRELNLREKAQNFETIVRDADTLKAMLSWKNEDAVSS